MPQEEECLLLILSDGDCLTLWSDDQWEMDCEAVDFQEDLFLEA